jgi:hypothetical protein
VNQSNWQLFSKWLLILYETYGFVPRLLVSEPSVCEQPSGMSRMTGPAVAKRKWTGRNSPITAGPDLSESFTRQLRLPDS